MIKGDLMFVETYTNSSELKTKHFTMGVMSSNTFSYGMFKEQEVSEDLINKLESIEEDMLNGKSIRFKDVKDLERRYDL